MPWVLAIEIAPEWATIGISLLIGGGAGYAAARVAFHRISQLEQQMVEVQQKASENHDALGTIGTSLATVKNDLKWIREMLEKYDQNQRTQGLVEPR